MVNSSTFGSSNKMAGLMSGLDTEALVKTMTMATQSRIDSQNQKLQTLQWKQEAYQDNISDLNKFSDDFLSMAGENSVKARASMNKYTTECSDDRVTASATSSANPTTYKIVGAKSATTAEIISKQPVAGIGEDSGIDLNFSGNEDAEYKVKITLNGAEREVKFQGVKGDSAAAQENFIKAVNEEFKDVLGGKTFTFKESKKEGSVKLSIDGGDENIIDTFSVGYNSKAVGLGNDAYNMIGYNSKLGDCNFTRTLDKTADGKYAMNINGTKFEFDDDTTISDMISTINDKEGLGVEMSFSSVSQTFSLKATESGTAGCVEISNVGSSNLASSLFMTNGAQDRKAYGTNGTLTLEVNNQKVTYTSASNNYTFDGTTINIEDLGNFEANEAEGVEAITITSTRDTESIKDTVVKFIEEYNKLIDGIYSELKEAPIKYEGEYYKPLTEEQKEEMDKEEIDEWNEAAKKGLLYQDSLMTKIAGELRMTMTSSVNGFSLSDMGITLSKGGNSENASAWSDVKLYIDEDKLDQALSTYGDEITDFFTAPIKYQEGSTTKIESGGLASKLEKVINSATSTSKSKYGYLTQVAGVKNTASAAESSIFRQINSINSYLTRLEYQYEKQTERYWDQFTRLETYMSNMQAQSSSLFGTTTGGNTGA